MAGNKIATKHNVVHIGLGKAATTTLQAHIFPLLIRLGLFDYYNEKTVFNKIKNLLRQFPTPEQIESVKSHFEQSKNHHFVSHESLAHWNPEFWQRSRDRNLALFGPQTTILITLRKPTSYLRSLYQQKMQSGNVIEPSRFFVSAAQYKRSNGYIRPELCEKYPIDEFSFLRLVSIYTESFAKVVVIPFEEIARFDYLSEICEIDSEQLTKIRREFQNAPRENRSSSHFTMNMILFRERMLNVIGLKTLGSNDTIHEQFLDSISQPDNFSPTWSIPKSLDRFLSFLRKLSGRLRLAFIRQAIYGALPKSKKFSLPPELDLGAHHQENEAFYSSLLNSTKGYRTFSKGETVSYTCHD